MPSNPPTIGYRPLDVDSIMTRRVISVSMDDDLRTIHDIFVSEQFHHVLVIENDHRLAGIISDRDFFKAVSPNITNGCTCPKGIATLNKKAHQVMSRYPVVLRSGTSVACAIEVMEENGLSCLPVVNNLGIAIGIVSCKDILRYLVPMQTATAEAGGG